MTLKATILVTAFFSSALVAQAEESLPKYNLTIKIPEFGQSTINVNGTVTNLGDKPRFAILPGQNYKFDIAGKAITVADGKPLDIPASSTVHFEGSSTFAPSAKLQSTADEFYCLNKVYPNPEIYADGGYYYGVFAIPKDSGFHVLYPSDNVVQRNGMQFQYAKLSPPVDAHTGKMRLQLNMPVDFQPDKDCLQFMSAVLDDYVEKFGPLKFSTLKIGAIRRGGDREINGSPSGDLIFFSRTALGASLNEDIAHPDGSKTDMTNSLRRLVIGHELAHLWFGEKFQGDEAWFAEGVPQYLGLIKSVQSISPEESKALLAFMRKRAESGPPTSIPQAEMNNDAGMTQAYYSAPLALFDVGEKIGHEKLIAMLVNVSSEKSKVTFADLDKTFKAKFPHSMKDWNRFWGIPAH